MVYKPAIYNASNPASMVITLHGLGDNMSNFSTLGFNYIADTANIIVVVPQAIDDPTLASFYGVGNGTAWNSGAGFSGFYPNSSVDDVGFLNSLIDTIKVNFSIDPSRVYMCGFSMGGFMTERMALQSNKEIAAFVSMSGTFGSAIAFQSAGRSVPVAHFHGTSDATVAYTGDSYGIDPDSLIHYWVLNNSCNPVPDSSRYPDIANDTITVDLFKYSGASRDNDVWFFRMNGATHTILYQPANDINEVVETWLFFRRHRNMTAGIKTQTAFENNIQEYPNPANSFINLILPETSETYTVELFSTQGECLYSKNVHGSLDHIILNDGRFSNGMYILRVTGNSVNASQRIIIQK
jgi:poly(3-hydroxybutyrate) depolymerase